MYYTWFRFVMVFCCCCFFSFDVLFDFLCSCKYSDSENFCNLLISPKRSSSHFCSERQKEMKKHYEVSTEAPHRTWKIKFFEVKWTPNANAILLQLEFLTRFFIIAVHHGKHICVRFDFFSLSFCFLVPNRTISQHMNYFFKHTHWMNREIPTAVWNTSTVVRFFN